MSAAAPDYDRAAGRATLVLADVPERRARLGAAVAAAGGRLAAADTLAAGVGLIAAQPGTAAVAVLLDRDGGAALDALLAGVAAAVRAARIEALVVAPAELIDIVDAGLGDCGAAMLVDPSDGETAAALARLVAPRPAGVAEAGDETQRRLAALSEETARIARALASLAEGAEPAATPGDVDPQTLFAATRGMIRSRRLREQFFDASLFADPAWDMLLDLYAARLERRQVAVSSLCIAAAVPATTALRWIAMMTGQRLIERRPDPADRRRMFLALGDRAADAMAAYVATTLRHLAPVSP